MVTIKSYRSAIGAVHQGFADGTTIGSNPIVLALLKGMFHTRPRTRRLAPAWSISEVLVALARAPFEPMSTISLHNLTRKTAFLIAAASARRRGTIHALTVKEGFLRFDPSGVTLLPDPSFLAKNQTMSFTPEPIHIDKMSRASSIAEDKFWCPVRALKWYLDRTRRLRSSQQLFVQSKRPHAGVTRATISRWIADLIKEVVADPEGIRAHDVRGQAASKAWFAHVPLEEIMRAATWKTPTTFVSTYMVDTVSAERSFSRTVLTVPR